MKESPSSAIHRCTLYLMNQIAFIANWETNYFSESLRFHFDKSERALVFLLAFHESFLNKIKEYFSFLNTK